MIYNHLEKKGLFPLFQYICDQQQERDCPFKLHICMDPRFTKASSFALRGWFIDVAKQVIPGFVPPSAGDACLVERTDADMFAELSKPGDAVYESSSDDEDVGKKKKKKGVKNTVKKAISAAELWALLAVWENRHSLNKVVSTRVQLSGAAESAPVSDVKEKILIGDFDSCGPETRRFLDAVDTAFGSCRGSTSKAAETQRADGVDATLEEEAEDDSGDAASTVEFRTGNCLSSSFSASFLTWSNGKKAQLCICDPPWGIRPVSYDADWDKNEWFNFATEVNSCMRDDGVILLFLSHFLLSAAIRAFTRFGWKSFHQPMVWIHKVPCKVFMFNSQPFSAHCLILPLFKNEKFNVVIDQNLEAEFGFGGGTSLFHNVFPAKVAVYRTKPKDTATSKRSSKGPAERTGAASKKTSASKDTSASKGHSKGTTDSDSEEAAASSTQMEALDMNLSQGDTPAKVKNRFRIEQKPLDLLQMLIRRYAPVRDSIVIDPTFGTGSAGIATFLNSIDPRIGRRFFFGMDSDPDALVVANKWLLEVKRKGVCFRPTCSGYYNNLFSRQVIIITFDIDSHHACILFRQPPRRKSTRENPPSLKNSLRTRKALKSNKTNKV